MKRAVSWILVIAIMLGFFSMIAFSVFAESYVEMLYIYTPDIRPNLAISTDIHVEVQNATLKEVVGWVDENNALITEGVFEENKIYYLQVRLEAPEGQLFSCDTVRPVINDYNNHYSYSIGEDGKLLDIDIEFNFNPKQITTISVQDLPKCIEPGEASVPGGLSVFGPAILTAARWVNAHKQEVTAFEAGNLYYLEVTFAPQDGFEFRNWIDIYDNNGIVDNYDILSAHEAIAWLKYSLEPGVGDISLTVTGLEVGQSISDLQVTLPAGSNVLLDDVVVQDLDLDEIVKEGTFEKGKHYSITYILTAKDGYNLDDYGNISVSTATGLSYHVWNGALQITQRFNTCDPVGVVELKTSGVEVGAPFSGLQAQLLQGSDVVTLTGINVLDYETGEELQGNFETGKNYRIEYALEAKEGYDPEQGLTGILNGEDPYDLNASMQHIWIYDFFSTCEQIPSVEITLSQLPQLGSNMEDIIVTANDASHSLDYHWESGDSSEPLSGPFQIGCDYWLAITLEADDGYSYPEDTPVTVDGFTEDDYSVWNHTDSVELSIPFSFSYKEIEECWLDNMPYEIASGAVVPADLTVDSDDVTLVKTRWVDADKNPVTVFEDGQLYYLEVTLAPNDGFVFSDYFGVYGNMGYARDLQVTSTEATAWFKYSLQPGVGDIHLSVTGLEVGKPVTGLVVTLPDDATVELQGVLVYDLMNDTTVESGNFADKSRYYITYVLAPKAGYDIENYEHITINDGYFWSCECSGDALWVSDIFSTCMPVGDVQLQSSGLEVGKPIDGVQLQIVDGTGVSVGDIRVYDYETDEAIEDGNFEAGRNYLISYTLQVADGYSAEDGFDVTLDGENNVDARIEGQQIEITTYFTTCQVLDTVELYVTEPKVGEQLADVLVTCGSDLYAVSQWYWFDADTYETVTGAFQKGYAYRMRINLSPAQGYIFSDDLKIVLNGAPVTDWHVTDFGTYAACFTEWSLKDKISHVELTVPTAISKGDSLPVITAPEGANYRFESDWYILTQNGNKVVQEVTEDGIYTLQITVIPNTGYDFASDAAVLANGAAYNSYLNYGNEMFITKSFSFGMKVIDRVDITVAEPSAGGTPQQPVFAEGAGYACSRDWGWMSNTTDDLFSAWMTEEFTAGEYHYLYFIMGVEEGYALSEDVAFYVNGKEVPIVTNLNMGYAAQVGLSFGKLQEEGSSGRGDIDGFVGITESDAVCLLQHVLMPEQCPVDPQMNLDLDSDGKVTTDDAIYLLQHILMPDIFPLK